MTVYEVGAFPPINPELGDIGKNKEGHLFVWDGASWIDRSGHVMPEGGQIEVVWGLRKI